MSLPVRAFIAAGALVLTATAIARRPPANEAAPEQDGSSVIPGQAATAPAAGPVTREVSEERLSGATLPATRAATQSNLPDRLSHADYWRLIEDLSEPDGDFHSENFLSNEGTFQRYLVPLVDRIGTGKVYLGVGPEQNYSYIAALRPRIAFIVDIRRQNLILHMMYKAAFELSETRSRFLSRLLSREEPGSLPDTASTEALFAYYGAAPADPERFARNLGEVFELLVDRHGFRLTTKDSADLRHVYDAFHRMGSNIRYSTPRDGPTGGRYVTLGVLMTGTDDFGTNRTFLGNEDNYRIVRDMHLRNLIVPVVGDFAGPKALRAVGDYLRSRRASVSVFYVSNVESYLFRTAGTAQRFYANVATLPLDSVALFVRPPDSVFPPRSVSGRASSARMESEIPRFSSIRETLKAVQDGRITRHSDVFRIR